MKYTTDTIAIRKKMIELGINTIGELSEISGVNRNTLGSVISGETQPSSAVMRSLASALDFTPIECGCIFFKQKLT